MNYTVIKSDDFKNIEITYSALKTLEKKKMTNYIYIALKRCEYNEYGYVPGISSKDFYNFLLNNKKITQKSLDKLKTFHSWQISKNLYPEKLIKLLSLLGVKAKDQDDICCYFISLYASECNELRKRIYFILRNELGNQYTIDILNIPTNISNFVIKENHEVIENSKEIILDIKKQEQLIQMLQDSIEMSEDGDTIANLILIANVIGLNIN